MCIYWGRITVCDRDIFTSRIFCDSAQFCLQNHGNSPRRIDQIKALQNEIENRHFFEHFLNLHRSLLFQCFSYRRFHKNRNLRICWSFIATPMPVKCGSGLSEDIKVSSDLEVCRSTIWELWVWRSTENQLPKFLIEQEKSTLIHNFHSLAHLLRDAKSTIAGGRRGSTDGDALLQLRQIDSGVFSY